MIAKLDLRVTVPIDFENINTINIVNRHLFILTIYIYYNFQLWESDLLYRVNIISK